MREKRWITSLSVFFFLFGILTIGSAFFSYNEDMVYACTALIMGSAEVGLSLFLWEIRKFM